MNHRANIHIRYYNIMLESEYIGTAETLTFSVHINSKVLKDVHVR